jgi:phosphoglycolate phosphatase-like HAD superfamily hydrolase
MIILETCKKTPIKTAVFDFDGTLSTLRCGWESVMEPLMLEILYGKHPTAEEIDRVRSYISASTGIQTILQMKWIAEQLTAVGREARSPWDYKAEYNRRLMERVEQRRLHAAAGNADDYLIRGGKAFLEKLRAKGVKIYAASGTDEEDVRREAEILGIAHLFDEIAGAKPFSEDCSKEATLARLIGESGGDGLLVVGDGPVEIRLGRAVGAATVGIAANERERCGFDEVKCQRLRDAGAHILCDGFEAADEIFAFLEGTL